jgi:hypothetical protein
MLIRQSAEHTYRRGASPSGVAIQLQAGRTGTPGLV